MELWKQWVKFPFRHAASRLRSNQSNIKHRIGGRQRSPCFGMGGVAVGIPLFISVCLIEYANQGHECIIRALSCVLKYTKFMGRVLPRRYYRKWTISKLRTCSVQRLRSLSRKRSRCSRRLSPARTGKKNSPLFVEFRHGDTSVPTGGNPVPTGSISTKTECPTGLKFPPSGVTEKMQTASTLDATDSIRSLRRSSVIECHPSPKHQGHIQHHCGTWTQSVRTRHRRHHIFVYGWSVCNPGFARIVGNQCIINTRIGR